MLTRLLAYVGLAGAARMAAQAPLDLEIFKFDQYTQQSPSSVVATGYLLEAQVAFASTAPAGANVTLSGPRGTVTLQRQPDGTFFYSQSFGTRAALDGAYPDGSYSVSVTGGTSLSTTPFAIVFGPPLAPAIFTNYTALQSWSSTALTLTWSTENDLSTKHYFSLDVYDQAGNDYDTNNQPTLNVPAGQPLTAVLSDSTANLIPPNYTSTYGVMGCGYILSVNFEVVVPAPIILTQPNSQVVPVGAMANIALTADLPGSTNPITVAWSKNGTLVSSGTNWYLNFGHIQPSDAGGYVAQVSTPGGAVMSTTGWLAVSAGVSSQVYAGSFDGSVDGTLTTAAFESPSAIAADAAGNLYITDAEAATIRKISPAGVVSTIAGQVGRQATVNGPSGVAQFIEPLSIAVDGLGNLYISDGYLSILDQNFPGQLRRIDASGNVTSWASEGGWTTDASSAADISGVAAMAADKAGNLYFVQSDSPLVISKIAADGSESVIGGGAQNGATSGTAATFAFGTISGLACDGTGNLYVADSQYHRILQVSPSGTVTTFAGHYSSAAPSGLVDGPLGAATFGYLDGLTADPAGDIFVVDGSALREISTQGLVTTLADPSGYAPYSRTHAFAWTSSGSGTLYFTDSDVIDSYSLIPGNPNPQVTIVGPPKSAVVAAGSAAAFSIAAVGPALAYQWFQNGTAIPGANSPELVLYTTSSASAGSYTVEVGNGAGFVTSAAAQLTIAATTDVGRLVNLSTRANAGTDAQTLTLGFVVDAGTSASEPLLVRGIGPSLANYGVSGFLPDPAISILNPQQQLLAANSTWAGDPALATKFAAAGAFPLADNSLDAALATSLATGPYSVQVSGNGQTTGVALAEIYDLSPGPAGGGGQLVNISARAQAGSGAGVLTAGFVVGGSTAETVLVRGIGPTLSQFGITSALVNPTLTVFDAAGNVVATNAGWGGDPTLGAVFSAVSAFSLPSSSADCALVATLSPGNYTAQVSGANGTTGIALVEIYAVR